MENSRSRPHRHEPTGEQRQDKTGGERRDQPRHQSRRQRRHRDDPNHENHQTWVPLPEEAREQPREGAKTCEPCGGEHRQFIQNWLDQTRAQTRKNTPDSESESGRHRPGPTKAHKLPPWRPHNLPVADEEMNGRAPEGFPPARHTQGCGPGAGAPTFSPRQARVQIILDDASYGSRSPSKRDRKRPRSPSRPPRSSSSSLPRMERRYEKKIRRKTHENKYDFRSGASTKQKDKENDGRVGRKTEGKKKKNNSRLSSTRDVADKFVSEAILNQRLTVSTGKHTQAAKFSKTSSIKETFEQTPANRGHHMQPSLKPGIFRNSRTTGVQPLADLQFGEMALKTNTPTEHARTPVGQSRGRGREHRREGKEREETLAFFQRNMASTEHENAEKGGRHRESSWSHRDQSGSPIPTGRTYAKEGEAPRPRSSSRRRLEGFREPGTTHRTAAQGPRTETSYFTWSPSHHSLVLRALPEPKLSAGASPVATLGSAKRALIETGVFDVHRLAPPGSNIPQKTPEQKKTEGNFTASYAIRQQQPVLENRVVRYRDTGVMTTEQSFPGPGRASERKGLGSDVDGGKEHSGHHCLFGVSKASSLVAKESRVVGAQTQSSLQSAKNLGSVQDSLVNQSLPNMEPPPRPSSPKSHMVAQLEYQAQIICELQSPSFGQHQETLPPSVSNLGAEFAMVTHAFASAGTENDQVPQVYDGQVVDGQVWRSTDSIPFTVNQHSLQRTGLSATTRPSPCALLHYNDAGVGDSQLEGYEQVDHEFSTNHDDHEALEVESVRDYIHRLERETWEASERPDSPAMPMHRSRVHHSDHGLGGTLIGYSPWMHHAQVASSRASSRARPWSGGDGRASTQRELVSPDPAFGSAFPGTGKELRTCLGIPKGHFDFGEIPEDQAEDTSLWENFWRHT